MVIRGIFLWSFCSAAFLSAAHLFSTARSKSDRYQLIRAEAGAQCVTPKTDVFEKEDALQQFVLMLDTAYTELKQLRGSQQESLDEKQLASTKRIVAQRKPVVRPEPEFPELKGLIDGQLWETLMTAYFDDINVLRLRIGDLEEMLSTTFQRAVDRSQQVLSAQNLNAELRAQLQKANEETVNFKNRLNELEEIQKHTDQEKLELKEKIDLLLQEKQQLEQKALYAENKLSEYIKRVEQLASHPQ